MKCSFHKPQPVDKFAEHNEFAREMMSLNPRGEEWLDVDRASGHNSIRSKISLFVLQSLRKNDFCEEARRSQY